jgi:DHA2 family multidrug resistance protein
VLLASRGTSLSAADQLRLPLTLAAAGQVLFLLPNLIAGARLLTPRDGPTASLMFNGTTVGGAALGTALATEFVMQRQRFHWGNLAESASGSGVGADRIETLAGAFASRVSDDAAAAAQATAAVASAFGRETAILSFNDGLLAAGIMIAMSAAGLLLFNRQPPIGAMSAQ